ncbi:hypothetical protein [Limosilactobacillus oris]|uniref:hypothetical protein n=1 Tax=Limosilactobacillus oris TaxID=1632 RepID=UPI001883D069|nr:hypothetical protein [Limosilactobacillus oris]MBF0601158.1 hypothetical protein [Limosilactobacillus oris]
MKKLQRLVFAGLLVLTLAFGLAGCGSNHDSSKSATSKDKVTKVVKHKSSSKDKQSSKKSSQSESDENSTSANSNATTNDSKSSTSSSSQESSSQKQLGLNDVAVWTDENGVTHHVDSDGMDRQTSPNQSGVTYKDWSGSLPSNAQIVKQN